MIAECAVGILKFRSDSFMICECFSSSGYTITSGIRLDGLRFVFVQGNDEYFKQNVKEGILKMYRTKSHRASLGRTR